MYPQRELKALALHKLRLQRGIALRRAASVAATAQIARPFLWLDRLLAVTRRIQPFAALAAVPLGLLVGQTLIPRRRILGALVRWGPAVFGAVRGLKSAFRHR